jgi:GTP-sensing pleiotropic transcriptional regulator CodY
MYEWENLGSGNWKVRFIIEQVQTNTVFFRMPVEIKVNFSDGTDTLVNVINDANPQLFEFIFTRQPIGVTFDPDKKILLKQATTRVGIHEKKSNRINRKPAGVSLSP